MPPIEWHATVCNTYSARCVALPVDVLVLSTRCVCELSVDYPQTVCRTVCGLFFSQTRCPPGSAPSVKVRLIHEGTQGVLLFILSYLQIALSHPTFLSQYVSPYISSQVTVTVMSENKETLVPVTN